jgi:hypothetical protein
MRGELQKQILSILRTSLCYMLWLLVVQPDGIFI